MLLSLLLLTHSAAAFTVMGPTAAPTRHRAPVCGLLGGNAPPATVGEAKDRFNAAYGRAVGGMQQGFVNELITACQLAQISPTYKPSRVFSLGFESLCTTFLNGMSDEDAAKLSESMAIGVGLSLKQVKADAEKLTAAAKGMSEDELLAGDDLSLIASTPSFKYSYPLGAGLLALMPLVDVEPSKEACERWATKLGLPASRFAKDWEFFEDATRKLVEGRQMLVEMKAAAKRKEAQKLKDEAEKAAKEADEAEEVAEKAEQAS